MTWTFDIREGVKWSDGEPFTAADIAYTYNRVLRGDVEGALYGSYLTSVTSVDRTGRHDHRAEARSKPNAVLPLLPIPIIPEHIWKNVSEKAAATYPAEPNEGHPVVGTGPFILVEGKAGGSRTASEDQSGLLGRRAAHRCGELPGLQGRGHRWSRP